MFKSWFASLVIPLRGLLGAPDPPPWYMFWNPRAACSHLLLNKTLIMSSTSGKGAACWHVTCMLTWWLACWHEFFCMSTYLTCDFFKYACWEKNRISTMSTCKSLEKNACWHWLACWHAKKFMCKSFHDNMHFFLNMHVWKKMHVDIDWQKLHVKRCSSVWWKVLFNGNFATKFCGTSL